MCVAQKSFLQLPDLVLSEIISKLAMPDQPSFRRTCSRWYDALPAGALSHRVDHSSVGDWQHWANSLKCACPNITIAVQAKAVVTSWFCDVVVFKANCGSEVQMSTWSSSTTMASHLQKTAAKYVQTQQGVQDTVRPASVELELTSYVWMPSQAVMRGLATIATSLHLFGGCPESITLLTRLSALHLRLPSSPQELVKCQRVLLSLPLLQKLSVSYSNDEAHDISSALSCLSAMHGLKELEINSNRLLHLADVDQLQHITRLKTGGCTFAFEVPLRSLRHLQLKDLSFHHAPFMTVLERHGCPSDISIHEVSPNGLRVLPSNTRQLFLLGCLSCSSPSGTLCRKALSRLTALRVLHLTEFPTEVVKQFTGVQIPFLHTFGFGMPSDCVSSEWGESHCPAASSGHFPKQAFFMTAPSSIAEFVPVFPHIKVFVLSELDRVTANRLPHVFDASWMRAFSELCGITIKLSSEIWQFHNLPNHCFVIYK